MRSRASIHQTCGFNRIASYDIYLVAHWIYLHKLYDVILIACGGGVNGYDLTSLYFLVWRITLAMNAGSAAHNSDDHSFAAYNQVFWR